MLANVTNAHTATVAFVKETLWGEAERSLNADDVLSTSIFFFNLSYQGEWDMATVQQV